MNLKYNYKPPTPIKNETQSAQNRIDLTNSRKAERTRPTELSSTSVSGLVNFEIGSLPAKSTKKQRLDTFIDCPTGSTNVSLPTSSNVAKTWTITRESHVRICLLLQGNFCCRKIPTLFSKIRLWTRRAVHCFRCPALGHCEFALCGVWTRMTFDRVARSCANCTRARFAWSERLLWLLSALLRSGLLKSKNTVVLKDRVF